jgi:toxin ParE1/3/4
MTYNLRFFSEVEEDVVSSYAWYEEKSDGLGEDFLRMFYASTAAILRNPLLSPKVLGEFRRRLLQRFPFAIYFTVERDEIIVFGLFHCARDPRSITLELHERHKRDML